MLLVILFMPIEFYLGLNVVGIISVAAVVISLSALLYLKKNKDISFFSNLFLFNIFAVILLGLLTTGGYDSPTAFYLIFVPMLAMIIKNRKVGFFWCVAVVLINIYTVVARESIKKYFQTYDFTNDLIPIEYFLQAVCSY